MSTSVALTYKQTMDTGKTKIWLVLGPAGGAIGEVRWYPQWRRYIFEPDGDTIFDADCLGQVVSFITARMRERKT